MRYHLHTLDFGFLAGVTVMVDHQPQHDVVENGAGRLSFLWVDAMLFGPRYYYYY